MQVLPSPCRVDKFEVVARCLSACWCGSPYLTDVLSPSAPPLDSVGPCSCPHPSTGSQHVFTREWQHLRCCRALSELLGDTPLQMQVFPSVSYIQSSAKTQLRRLLKSVGFAKEDARRIIDTISAAFYPSLAIWAEALPPFLQLRLLRPAPRHVHRAGLLFLKVDRNPQRLVDVCRHIWFQLHRETFIYPRYELTVLGPSCADPSWANAAVDSFRTAFQEKGCRPWFSRAPNLPARPVAHFTVKQKSLLKVCPPVVKIRPLTAHHRHPLRTALRRAVRALSLLVQAAVPFVQNRLPHHIPMCKALRHFFKQRARDFRVPASSLSGTWLIVF